MLENTAPSVMTFPDQPFPTDVVVVRAGMVVAGGLPVVVRGALVVVGGLLVVVPGALVVGAGAVVVVVTML